MLKSFATRNFYFQNSAAATQVYADCDRRWNDLLEKYFMVYSDMKVDRVIFVASAANERLPHSLMKCVMDAARPPPFRGLKRRKYESFSRQNLSSEVCSYYYTQETSFKRMPSVPSSVPTLFL